MHALWVTWTPARQAPPSLPTCDPLPWRSNGTSQGFNRLGDLDRPGLHNVNGESSIVGGLDHGSLEQLSLGRVE